MIYGYARVSSKEQNLERQIKELKGAGVEERNILMDKQSGKDFNRKSYNLLVGTDTTAPLLREGDVLTVYSIDRLGRNYTEIMKQWQYITQEIKADIRVLDMPLLDTRNRQSQGIAVAKEQGKHLGRPAAEFPDNWEAVYNEWKSHNITAVQAMKQTNLKKNTFYNLVKRYENK